MDLLINPPTKQNSHSETITKYNNELSTIRNDLKEKSIILTTHLNKMKYFSCNEIEGKNDRKHS